ncbi:MAG: phosphatase PAP2 family protein [Candidatus Pacebacteria bacterium]|nr:phosphatase PAP2 family protein [Candidatus Paceibacterota bacterium]
MIHRLQLNTMLGYLKARTGLELYLGCSAVLAAIFLFFPSIDLGLARLTNLAPGVFILSEVAWITLVQQNVWVILASGLVFALGVYGWNWYKKSDLFGLDLRGLIFIAAAALVGPGLMVNGVFKFMWGRARPNQIIEFGGLLKFTPAGMVSLQCPANCSFVSGDVSLGFWLVAFAFLLSSGWYRRGFLILGLGLGALVGLMRIGQGGHFLSDVVYAGIITIGVQFLLAQIILNPSKGKLTGIAPIQSAILSARDWFMAVGCKLVRGFAMSDLRPVAILTLVLILVTMAIADIPLATLAVKMPYVVTKWAEKLSIFGSSGPYFIIAIMAWVAMILGARDEFGTRLRNYSWLALLVIVALAVSGIATNILKLIFAHLRPKEFFGGNPRIGFHLLHLDMIGDGFFRSFRKSFSFPSGHTTTAFALATVAAAVFGRYRLWFYGAAGLVGVARVLALAHWPSDILAGALVGLVTAEYCVLLFNAAGIGPAAVLAGKARPNGKFSLRFWQAGARSEANLTQVNKWLQLRKG